MLMGNRWTIEDKKTLGMGGIGCVVSGVDIKSGEGVAVKLVNCIGKDDELLHEKSIYDHLHTSGDATGIPKIHYYGKLSEDLECLVMQRLGFSLQNYKEAYNGQIPVNFALLIALQALDRLEFIHDKGLLHLDVKPGNLLIGKKDPEVLYLVDFGFARGFSHSETSKQINHCPEEEEGFVGTLDFASRNMHAESEVSRKDDLESLGYSLIYMIKGELPWTKKANYTPQPYAEMDPDNYISEDMFIIFQIRESITAALKNSTDDEDLCDNIPCYSFFLEYFKNVRQLTLEERPDYESLREIFRSGLRYMLYDDSDFIPYVNQVQEILEGEQDMKW